MYENRGFLTTGHWLCDLEHGNWDMVVNEDVFASSILFIPTPACVLRLPLAVRQRYVSGDGSCASYLLSLTKQ